MPIQLSQYLDLPTAARWLTERTGDEWLVRSLLDVEQGLRLYLWLEYKPGYPAVFGNCTEGYMAPICFVGDQQRLAFDGSEGVLTMTRTADGTLMRITPGAPFTVADVRVDRESLEQLANTIHPESETADARRKRWRAILREEHKRKKQGALARAAKRVGVKRQTFADAFGKGATVADILASQ